MLANQRICGTWRTFLKNSRQLNCSGQTRDSWTTITKQKNTAVDHSGNDTIKYQVYVNFWLQLYVVVVDRRRWWRVCWWSRGRLLSLWMPSAGRITWAALFSTTAPATTPTMPSWSPVMIPQVHTHRHGRLNTLYLCLRAYKGSECWPSRITSCQGHKIEPTLANTGCAPTSQKTAWCVCTIISKLSAAFMLCDDMFSLVCLLV